MTIDPACLTTLAQFDTPTICNTIELFDVQPRVSGYTHSRVQSCFPELPPAVGFAATASFRSSAPAKSGSAYTGIEEQLAVFADLPGPAMVVIQDIDDPVQAAVFGEVMCSSYQAFGAVGLITNGAGRDLLQVKALGFPVFTSSTIVSHGYCHLLHLGLPVTIDGLVIEQADLLHADANGIATIPRGLAQPIADLAGKFVEAEEIIMGYVKAEGPKSVGEYADRRREFSQRVKQLQTEAQQLRDQSLGS